MTQEKHVPPSVMKCDGHKFSSENVKEHPAGVFHIPEMCLNAHECLCFESSARIERIKVCVSHSYILFVSQRVI